MLEQHFPVLIFAQSGRFLAQAASQAGFKTVWVADCFGDSDCQDIAARWQQLPPFSQLDPTTLLKYLIDLSRDQPCQIICGSGIEKYYSILTQLPDNIMLIGNSAATINIIKTPQLFFSLLSQLNIAYPKTQFKPPNRPHDYLVKSASGLGGNHIQILDQVKSLQDGYFQQQIHGSSGSALFLADGQKAILLSVNKQWLDPCDISPYRLGGLETAVELSRTNQPLLTSAINNITTHTGLVGLNSIDFIITAEDQLLILEINPRPSASAELIADDRPILQYHIEACRGHLPNKISYSIGETCALQYLYATTAFTIPSTMIWSKQCYDRPVAGTRIEPDQPICTLIVSGENSMGCHQQLMQLSQKIYSQLSDNN